MHDPQLTAPLCAVPRSPGLPSPASHGPLLRGFPFFPQPAPATGKASPQTLTGSELDASVVDTPAAERRLYDRVTKDHRRSIEAAVNLDVSHFYCRMLVLNAVWVPLTESALIGRYVPIWNSVVTGFGNHDPGAGRMDGRISRWDILHPGRGRETDATPSSTFDAICAEAKSAISDRIRLLGL